MKAFKNLYILEASDTFCCWERSEHSECVRCAKFTARVNNEKWVLYLNNNNFPRAKGAPMTQWLQWRCITSLLMARIGVVSGICASKHDEVYRHESFYRPPQHRNGHHLPDGQSVTQATWWRTESSAAVRASMYVRAWLPVHGLCVSWGHHTVCARDALLCVCMHDVRSTDQVKLSCCIRRRFSSLPPSLPLPHKNRKFTTHYTIHKQHTNKAAAHTHTTHTHHTRSPRRTHAHNTHDSSAFAMCYLCERDKADRERRLRYDFMSLFDQDLKDYVDRVVAFWYILSFSRIEDHVL